MSKLAQHYPQLRLAIYGIIAAVLGALTLFGLFTEDQTEALLGYVGTGLGFVGTVLALLNVKTAAPSVDAPAIADQVAARINTGVKEVDVVVTESIADLRRQAEERLGQRF